MSYYKKIVLLMSFAFGAVALERFSAAFVLPGIQKEFALNYTQAGIVVAVFGLTWAVGVFALGGLSDYVGRKPVMVSILIIGGLCSWISGIAGTFVFLVIIRGVMGFVEGGVWGPIAATIVEESPPESRARNMGFINGGFMLAGVLLAPILSMQLMAHLGWRYVFYLYAIPAILLGILLQIIMRESPTIEAVLSARRHGTKSKRIDAEGKEIRYGDMFKYRNIWVLLICWIITMAFLWVFTTFAVFLLVKVHNLSLPTVGLIMSGFGLGGFFGGFVFGHISDRIGRKKSLFLMFFLTGITALLLTSLSQGTSLGLLFALMALSAFFFAGSAGVVVSTIGETVGFALAASAIGVVTGVGELVGAGGLTIVGGGLADALGIRTPLYLAGILCIVNAFCCLFLHETAPRFVKIMRPAGGTVELSKI